MDQNILFIGCGKLGSIILNKLIENKIFTHKQIKVLKKTNNNKIPEIDYLDKSVLLKNKYSFDLVFVCIKPQNAEKILNKIPKNNFNNNTIFISFLAGKKIKFFEKIFGENSKIIRIMPNVAIKVNEGILPYFFNKNITKKDEKELFKIFNNLGLYFKLENENSFNAITALFGSGPAYIFLLQKILYELSISYKIKKDIALQLVKKLFLGSSIVANTSESFDILIKKVMSKNGTTEQAVNVLNKKNITKKLFEKAIKKAYEKSRSI